MHFVLIDDNLIFQTIFRKLIQKKYQDTISLKCFCNGQDAFGYFQESLRDSSERPVILFVDINMPYMNGWDFLSNLAEEDLDFVSHTPIYLVSSSNSRLDLNRAESIDYINGFLVKPFEVEALFGIIQQYLPSS